MEATAPMAVVSLSPGRAIIYISIIKESALSAQKFEGKHCGETILSMLSDVLWNEFLSYNHSY